MPSLPCRCLGWALACALLTSIPAQASDWVLLYDQTHYWTSNVDLPVCRKIRELQPKNLPFKCVAFTQHGGWVVLYGKNGYFAHDIPQAAFDKLGEIARSGGASKWIALAPDGGWCILHGQNGFDAGQLPDAVVDKLRAIGRAGGTLKSIAFTAAGGCVVLFDANSSWAWGAGVPAPAQERIAEVAGEGAELTSIAFTPSGGWTLLWGRRGNWSAGIPQRALERMHEIHEAGGTLTAIAYAQADEPFDPQARYTLETRPSRRVQATLDTNIRLSSGKVDHWYLYAPLAPNLPSQHDVTTRFDQAARIVHEVGPLARSLNFVQFNDGRTAVHTTLSVDATLYSRRLVVLADGQSAPAVADLSPAEIAQHTRSSALVDYQSPAVQTWIASNRLTRADTESDLVFAHRVFSFIKRHFTYEFPTQHHSALQACETGVSDCGGLSSLFAAVMRSQGVPTRLLGGRWAASQTAKSTKVHVKAEFFARGIGWVPVDASSAVTHENGENLFFGHDPGDHLVLMSDEDVLVDSIAFGPQHLRYMQGVHYWWRGSGNKKDLHFEERWTVRMR